MGNSAGKRTLGKGRLAKAQAPGVERLFARALALQASGVLPDARAVYRQLLQLSPSHFDALYWLGRLEYGAQSYEAAEALLRDAVRANPRSADAHKHLAATLKALRRLEEAHESYRRSLALNPNDAVALNNLGNICRDLNRLQEAVDCFDKAVAIGSDIAELHCNRGLGLIEVARYDDALASFDRALAINPRYAVALGGRGSALCWLGRYAEALECCNQSIALDPANVVAWSNRAQALLQMNRVSEAIQSCERTLVLSPSAPDQHAVATLGQCFERLGRIKEAVASYDAALAIQPDFEPAISNRIFCLDFAEDADFEVLRDARRIWWERIGAPIAASAYRDHPNKPDPDRRLIIGYVSADFRQHSAALAFKPVLLHRDREQFEIICYSCSPWKDAVTDAFRQMADRWRDASQWTEEQLARQIRLDAVDILVDLAGHTEGNRLRAFARKPAPVQAHGWGHVTPPGLPTIDYVFADPVSIPEQVRHLFCETIHDLPCILTIEPLPGGVTNAETPALANGFVTFGVFNRINKITDTATAVWSRILSSVPHSRLLLKHGTLDDPVVCGNLLARFARFGAPTERIMLMGSSPRVEHLAALNNVDICFDPFPHNGGASTWEALQMGVPVIARLGNTQVGRAGAAIVTAAGLPDWVAASDEAYVDIAVRWASQIPALAALRRDLPARIAATAAGDPVRYAQAVGNAYRTMWRTYCARNTA